MSGVSRQTKHLEHFSQGGNGVTNFDIERIHLYCRTIEEYGDGRLYVGEPIPAPCDQTNMRALRIRDLSLGDLSDFWELFDKLKKNMEK
jgi:hypothetical protein